MFDLINSATVMLFACIAFALSLPLLIVAYYLLRLRLRRNSLKAKIIELHLEPDYLRVFHFSDWEEVYDKPPLLIRSCFVQVFDKQFHGDNSFKNYLLPLGFTLITTSVFSFFLYDTVVLKASYTFIENKLVVFSLVGAMLYVYPRYIAKYASFSLNPPILFELVGRLWLSTIIGVVTASVVAPSLQAVSAFVGGLLPLASMDLLRKKVFEKGGDEDDKRIGAMLEILHDDRNLFSQLEYIGIRSVLELAYENPLKIFVGTDLNLVVCIDLVDQANLRLYVPDQQTRQELNRSGIRTAIDIMTQLYENLPSRNKHKNHREWRFLDPDEKLPDHLVAPMQTIATVLKLQNIDALRNIVQMMIDNPQLRYVFDLWGMLNERVDKSTAT